MMDVSDRKLVADFVTFLTIGRISPDFPEWKVEFAWWASAPVQLDKIFKFEFTVHSLLLRFPSI